MEEFIKYVKDEREEFVNVIRKQDWNNELRTAAESLLIAYDQMAAKLEECEGKADSTSEKDLRVCEVISRFSVDFGSELDQKALSIYRSGKYIGNILLDRNKQYTEEEMSDLVNDFLNGL